VIPAADLPVVVALAAGGSLAVAAGGVLALRKLRSRSLTHSTVTVALVPVAAVLVGALLTGNAMFLSAHDLSVLVVVTVVAGAVGLVTAVLLGRAVIAGSRSLGVAAANLGQGYVHPSQALSAELATLDGQLGEVSRQLQESRGRERSLESSRRELVAWVSHDLRTPLAGIRAMAEALEDRVARDQRTVERYHHGIRVEADRLAGMVDDLFELSKINASALRLSLQEVSLADLVSDAVSSARPVAAAKGVRLTGHADGSPVVLAGVPELGRVLRKPAVECDSAYSRRRSDLGASPRGRPVGVGGGSRRLRRHSRGRPAPPVRGCLPRHRRPDPGRRPGRVGVSHRPGARRGSSRRHHDHQRRPGMPCPCPAPDRRRFVRGLSAGGGRRARAPCPGPALAGGWSGWSAPAAGRLARPPSGRRQAQPGPPPQ